MITRLFGPEITAVQSLPESGLVYIDDHLGHDDTFDGFDHLSNLLNHSNCQVILEYAEAKWCLDTKFNQRVMCLPLQTYHTSHVMARLIPRRPTNNKYSVFNFSLNKIRHNRQYLLQKLVAKKLITQLLCELEYRSNVS